MQKRFLIFIVVVSIITLFVLVGFAYWLKDEATPSVQSHIPSLFQSVQPQPNSTANWKIYRNEKYGFTLKYPDVATVRTRGFESLAIGDEDFIAILRSDDESPFFVVEVYRIDHASVDDAIQEITATNDSGVGKKKIGEKMISGEKAVEIEVCGDPGCYRSFYLIHEHKLFELSHGMDQDNELFYAVLSTFQFAL